MPLNPLNHHYSLENPASIYDEEAMTALQLAGRTTAKVNETVEAFNKLEAETNAHLEQQDASIPVKIADKVQEHITGGQFDKQIDKYAGELEKQIYASEQALGARIDTFTRLPEGSTTGDAELADGRVSDLGAIHENVGGAIRKNLALLREHDVCDWVKENNFYSRFARVASTGAPAEHVVSLAEPMFTDRVITFVPKNGYMVGVSYWDNWPDTTWAVNYLWDSGWSEAPVTVSPGHKFMVSVKKVDDTVITLDDAYACMVKETHFHGHVYGNALDTILPKMAHGAFILSNPTCYDRLKRHAFCSSAPFLLEKDARIKVDNNCQIAVHTFSGPDSAPDTMTGDSGWQTHVVIPANTYVVLYFRHEPIEENESADLLKHIHMDESGVLNDVDLIAVNQGTLDTSIKAIAHRGYSNYGQHAPENTIPAYKLAKKMGFDYVECDVRITADGVPVLCHDDTIDRTSYGTGAVADMTLSELKEIDFSKGCQVSKYAGTKIPTFEEFILCCKRVGLKAYVELEPGTDVHLHTIYNIVKKYGMENAVTWICFMPGYLSALLEIDPAARIGYLVLETTQEVINTAKALKTSFNDVFINASVHEKDINTQAELAMVNGVQFECWCPNLEEEIQNLHPYITGITSEDKNAKQIHYDAEMEGV